MSKQTPLEKAKLRLKFETIMENARIAHLDELNELKAGYELATAELKAQFDTKRREIWLQFNPDVENSPRPRGRPRKNNSKDNSASIG